MQEGFQHSLSLYLCFCFPSSATQRVPAASPSAHSISTTTPDRTRFPRGSSSRSTFHGEQLRERRNATYNGPPASPSHETGAFAHARRGTSTGIISKITSKFVRRLVPQFLSAQPITRAMIAKSLRISSSTACNVCKFSQNAVLCVPFRTCLVLLRCIQYCSCLTSYSPVPLLWKSKSMLLNFLVHALQLKDKGAASKLKSNELKQ